MWFTMFSVEIDAGQTAVDDYKLLLRQIKYLIISSVLHIMIYLVVLNI